MVKKCKMCQSINALLCKMATQSVRYAWHLELSRYGCHTGKHFLTLTDCGSTWSEVWWSLLQQDSSSVIHQSEVIFYKQGYRQWHTHFCSRHVVHHWLWCTYMLSENGIAERCHQDVKRIVTRKQCTGTIWCKGQHFKPNCTSQCYLHILSLNKGHLQHTHTWTVHHWRSHLGEAPPPTANVLLISKHCTAWV